MTTQMFRVFDAYARHELPGSQSLTSFAEIVRARASSKITRMVIEAILEIKSHFVEGRFDVVTSDVARLSGRSPKPFQDVLSAALAQG